MSLIKVTARRGGGIPEIGEELKYMPPGFRTYVSCIVLCPGFQDSTIRTLGSNQKLGINAGEKLKVPNDGLYRNF